MGLKVLFSEGSSLTAREFLTVLGPAGHHIDILDPNRFCVCRFSRWTKRVHSCPPPARDPLGYLQAVNRLLVSRGFDVLLPTHEQAWLFAVARERLVADAPVAVASASAFSRVESKIEFARLVDEVGLPQPRWLKVESPQDLEHWSPPFYLKAPFSTAGAGVRRVANRIDAAGTLATLRAAAGGPVMVQAVADGAYGQVQALFDHGRLVAVHTSALTATGIGPSAAGRVGVDHAFARRDVALLGECLKWHGGLTLDYLFGPEGHAYIECNPRTTEPANAAASGVNLPELQLALSTGQRIEGLVVGRPGVRTHSSFAILLGKAAYVGTRRAVLREALRLVAHAGPYAGSTECLTPLLTDPASAIALALVATRALLAPASATRLAAGAIGAYSMRPDAVAQAAPPAP